MQTYFAAISGILFLDHLFNQGNFLFGQAKKRVNLLVQFCLRLRQRTGKFNDVGALGGKKVIPFVARGEGNVGFETLLDFGAEGGEVKRRFKLDKFSTALNQYLRQPEAENPYREFHLIRSRNSWPQLRFRNSQGIDHPKKDGQRS